MLLTILYRVCSASEGFVVGAPPRCSVIPRDKVVAIELKSIVELLRIAFRMPPTVLRTHDAPCHTLQPCACIDPYGPFFRSVLQARPIAPLRNRGPRGPRGLFAPWARGEAHVGAVPDDVRNGSSPTGEHRCSGCRGTPRKVQAQTSASYPARNRWAWDPCRYC